MSVLLIPFFLSPAFSPPFPLFYFRWPWQYHYRKIDTCINTLSSLRRGPQRVYSSVTSRSRHLGF